MISHEQKFIFIHIPKTGGTAIEHGLLQCNAKPDNFKFGHFVHCDTIQKDIAESYFVFAFHRNPWDRFVSLWKYWMFKKDLKGKYGVPEDFEWFCKNFDQLKQMTPKTEHVHFIQQSDINNQPEYVKPLWYPFETISESFKEICAKIGLDYKPLRVHNKTEHEPYQNYYNEELKNIVSQIYKKDIQCFNYEF